MERRRAIQGERPQYFKDLLNKTTNEEMEYE